MGIVFLRERKVTRCNQRFEVLLGYAAGELHGSSSRLWYHTEQEWLDAVHRWREPFMAGQAFEGEIVLRKKDGSAIHCEVRAKAVEPTDLSQGSIWILLDITARKKVENELRQARADLEKLVAVRTQELSRTVQALENKAREQQAAEAHIQHLAHYDPLTGLPNRSLLHDRSRGALSHARRNGEPVALMFLDLDHFKNINDSLGHSVGDEVLLALAYRLKAVVREQDTVARLGGDEFVLLLPDTDAKGAANVADKLLQTALRPIQVGQHELTVTPSIGIALYPKDGTDLDSLSRSADAAMYHAKGDGRNSYRFFTAEIQAQSDRTLLLDNALRRALERGQLSLHYQPQIALATGRVVGAEALLRWQHPELGAVSPARVHPGGREQWLDFSNRRMGHPHCHHATVAMAACGLAASHHGGQFVGSAISPCRLAAVDQQHSSGGRRARALAGTGVDRRRGHDQPAKRRGGDERPAPARRAHVD